MELFILYTNTFWFNRISIADIIYLNAELFIHTAPESETPLRHPIYHAGNNVKEKLYCRTVAGNELINDNECRQPKEHNNSFGPEIGVGVMHGLGHWAW